MKWIVSFFKALAGFFKSLLSQGGISSKRFWASVILTVLCFSFVWCTINVIQMPETTDAFIALAGVLLGIETAVSPFTKNNNGNNGTTTNDDNAEG